MLMIGEKRLGPDIKPETLNHGISTKNMIFTIWYKKTMKQMKSIFSNNI